MQLIVVAVVVAADELLQLRPRKLSIVAAVVVVDAELTLELELEPALVLELGLVPTPIGEQQQRSLEHQAHSDFVLLHKQDRWVFDIKRLGVELLPQPVPRVLRMCRMATWPKQLRFEELEWNWLSVVTAVLDDRVNEYHTDDKVEHW